MKFCKDCVHFTLPYAKAELTLGLCSRKTLPVDPVSGSIGDLNPHPFCRAERISLTGNCGHEARFFSKKDVSHV